MVESGGRRYDRGREGAGDVDRGRLHRRWRGFVDNDQDFELRRQEPQLERHRRNLRLGVGGVPCMAETPTWSRISWIEVEYT